MTRKFLIKPKVTDDQRHDRLVAMTHQIGASDDVKNFEKAFQKAFKSAFEERRPLEAAWRTSERIVRVRSGLAEGN